MNFLKNLVKPFTIIPKLKISFFCWFAFVIILGQLGIIASIFTKFHDFIDNIRYGNFYTFAIALLAAGILNWLEEYYYSRDSKFKSLKIVSVTFSILLIVFCTLFFSQLPFDNTKNGIIDISTNQIIIQIVLYFLSLIVALYTVCVKKLPEFYDDYKELDDQAIKELKENVDKLNNKAEGVKL